MIHTAKQLLVRNIYKYFKKSMTKCIMAATDTEIIVSYDMNGKLIKSITPQ